MKSKKYAFKELKNKNDESIAVRIGRFGVYLQGLEINTNLPDESIPSEISFEKAWPQHQRG